jgi:O-antigen/teichoic acid export membrane protein
MLNALLQKLIQTSVLRAINLALILVSTPLVISFHGIETYGLLVLCITIVGTGGLLDLGLPQIMVKILNRPRHFEENKKLFLLIYLAIIAVMSIILFLGAVYIYLTSIQMFVYLILCVSIVTKILLSYFQGIYNAAGKVATSDAINLLLSFSRWMGFLVTPFVNLNSQLNSSDEAFAIFPVGGILILIFLGRRYYISVPQCIPIKYKKIRSKIILNMSFKIFVARTSSEVSSHADKLIISGFLGLEALGIYNLSYFVASKLNDVGAVFSHVLFPQLAKEIDPKKNIDRAKVNKLLSWFSVLGFFVSIFMICVIPSIVIYWTKSWSFQNTHLFYILLAGMAFNFHGWVSSNLLILYNKETKVMLATLVVALINIFAMIVLLPYFELLGAALASCISYISMSLITMYFVRKLK